MRHCFTLNQMSRMHKENSFLGMKMLFFADTRHLNQFGAERKVGREHLRIQGRDSSKFEILFIETLNSRANCQEPDFRLKH